MIELLEMLLVGAAVLSLINALVVLNRGTAKIENLIVAISIFFIITVILVFAIGGV
jgi:hypothetical protein